MMAKASQLMVPMRVCESSHGLPNGHSMRVCESSHGLQNGHSMRVCDVNPPMVYTMVTA